MTFSKIKGWNIIVSYHGAYKRLGKMEQNYNVYANHCKTTQRNWHWITITEDKPLLLEKVDIYLQFEVYEKLEEFFENLDINSLTLEDTELKYETWYDFNQKKELGYEVESMAELTRKNIDLEWFISQEVQDGVYKPEKSTIDRILFSWRGNWSEKTKGEYKADKKLLKKLGVHTIQLRTNAHYDVKGLFDIAGMKVKAGKKIIENYGYEKYAENQEVVVQIKKDKEIAQQKEIARRENNKFTLVQHGDIILKNADRERLIDFLESFVPSDKLNSKKNMGAEAAIIDGVKEIFEEFEDLDRLYIAYWGTFYKYECAGERLDVNEDCYEMNRKFSGLSEEQYDEMTDLYDFGLNITESVLEKEYGWPERGGTIIGVERDGKKLKVFTENYDFE